jgi:hypothetical protein
VELRCKVRTLHLLLVFRDIRSSFVEVLGTALVVPVLFSIGTLEISVVAGLLIYRLSVVLPKSPVVPTAS